MARGGAHFQKFSMESCYRNTLVFSAPPRATAPPCYTDHPCKTTKLQINIYLLLFKYLFYSNTYFIQILFYSNTYFIQILIYYFIQKLKLFKCLNYLNTYFIYYSNTYLFIIQILCRGGFDGYMDTCVESS